MDLLILGLLMALIAAAVALILGNVNTYHNAETNPVRYPFASGTAINLGDLMWLSNGIAATPGTAGEVAPAVAWTWASAITSAAAPTLANGAADLGTAFTNAATHVKVSYQYPWGEGVLSSATNVTPTAGYAIKMSGVVLPAPALGLNVYVETSAGSGTYKLWSTLYLPPGQQGIGDTFITGYGNGQSPPASPPGEAATIVNQYYFAQQFAGVAAQAYDGTTSTRPGQGVNAVGLTNQKVRVDTDGVYEYPIASSSLNVASFLGIAANSTPNGLLSQQLVSVSSPALAIATVVDTTSSNTTVWAKINTRNLNLNNAIN